MKKVHLLLTKEQFEEMQEFKRKYFPNDKLDTYEEYLRKEKEKPTMFLFG